MHAAPVTFVGQYGSMYLYQDYTRICVPVPIATDTLLTYHDN